MPRRRDARAPSSRRAGSRRDRPGVVCRRTGGGSHRPRRYRPVRRSIQSGGGTRDGSPSGRRVDARHRVHRRAPRCSRRNRAHGRSRATGDAAPALGALRRRLRMRVAARTRRLRGRRWRRGSHRRHSAPGGGSRPTHRCARRQLRWSRRSRHQHAARHCRRPAAGRPPAVRPRLLRSPRERPLASGGLRRRRDVRAGLVRRPHARHRRGAVAVLRRERVLRRSRRRLRGAIRTLARPRRHPERRP